MNKNKTYILAAVFIILAVIAYYVTSDRGTKTTTYKKFEKQIFASDSATVNKIEIERQGKKIVLEKPASDWKLTSPVDYPANQQFAASLLSDLKNYKLESIVSDNPDRKNFYGFNDTNVAKVTVYQGGNLLGTFLAGNATNGPSQTYVKKVDGNEIYLADGLLRNNIVKENMEDWRDKLIISIPNGSVNSIEYTTAKESFKVVRDSTGSYFIGKDSVNKNTIDGVLNLLQSFNAQYFKDTLLGPETKFDYTIRVNWQKPTEFNFLKSTLDEKRYYLKVTDNRQVFEVDEPFLNNLVKSRKEILTGQK